MTTVESGAWIPKAAGDSLTGTVLEVIQGWSDARTNGGRDMDRGWYPLLRLETPDGTIRDWHAFSAVAENRVLDKQPLPGETITVTYLGESEKEPPKGQSKPKLFRLEIEGRDPQAEAQVVYGRLRAPTRHVDPPADLEPRQDTLPPGV